MGVRRGREGNELHEVEGMEEGVDESGGEPKELRELDLEGVVVLVILFGSQLEILLVLARNRFSQSLSR